MNGQEQDRQMKAIEEMERELAQPLGHFRDAMTTLAEREMTRVARTAVSAQKKPAWRAAWIYTWAPAGLLLLLLAVGLAKSDHGAMSQPTVNEPAVARVEQAPTPQRVSDSTLMTEIDEDLTQNAPTPLAPLEVSTTSETHTNSMQAEDTYGVEP